MPGKLGPVLKLGPVPEFGLWLGPRWALEVGQGSRSVFALKLGPGGKQMMIPEPKSVCELGLGPLEKLEPEWVLEPETASEMDPGVVLVSKTVSVLELVIRMLLELMTMSELERALGCSPFPKSVSEMEMSHQEWMLKLGLKPVSVQKLGLGEVMELGLVPQFELMMEPRQELQLAPVKKLRLKEFLE